MLLAVLAMIAVLLTIAMFVTRNLLLGFPSAIFWAIFGGHCYQESGAEWDIYYLIFFASMGMAIFSMYAAYTLREQDLAEPDADKGKYFDEKAEPKLAGIKEEPQGTYLDETKKPKLSDRLKALRERAKRRRST